MTMTVDSINEIDVYDDGNYYDDEEGNEQDSSSYFDSTTNSTGRDNYYDRKKKILFLLVGICCQLCAVTAAGVTLGLLLMRKNRNEEGSENTSPPTPTPTLAPAATTQSPSSSSSSRPSTSVLPTTDVAVGTTAPTVNDGNGESEIPTIDVVGTTTPTFIVTEELEEELIPIDDAFMGEGSDSAFGSLDFLLIQTRWVDNQEEFQPAAIALLLFNTSTISTTGASNGENVVSATLRLTHIGNVFQRESSTLQVTLLSGGSNNTQPPSSLNIEELNSEQFFNLEQYIIPDDSTNNSTSTSISFDIGPANANVEVDVTDLLQENIKRSTYSEFFIMISHKPGGLEETADRFWSREAQNDSYRPRLFVSAYQQVVASSPTTPVPSSITTAAPSTSQITGTFAPSAGVGIINTTTPSIMTTSSPSTTSPTNMQQVTEGPTSSQTNSTLEPTTREVSFEPSFSPTTNLTEEPTTASEPITSGPTSLLTLEPTAAATADTTSAGPTMNLTNETTSEPTDGPTAGQITDSPSPAGDGTAP